MTFGRSILTRCQPGSTRDAPAVGWSMSRTKRGRRGPCLASAAAWPLATWITTAGLISWSWARTSRWPISTTRPIAPGHFVTFRLEGTELEQRRRRRTRRRHHRPGPPGRATLGRRKLSLGLLTVDFISVSESSTSIQSVEVRWPSGRLDRWTDVTADAGYLLREGDPMIKPLAGFLRRAAAAVTPLLAPLRRPRSSRLRTEDHGDSPRSQVPMKLIALSCCAIRRGELVRQQLGHCALRGTTATSLPDRTIRSWCLGSVVMRWSERPSPQIAGRVAPPGWPSPRASRLVWLRL